eukprot:gnl/Spiro4/26184_TR13051_c0_g1_i1.p1 gnl/Spiro4/26184_TR13051_c0_g1~~gnl/Spiro4/26184_TR13051_c0_g1_i1.p1  ORF type:complete len:393 (+),score=108.91 gnl/Spiro4/26184_TR13051_c0_g1_i1:31-1179(+)
MAGSSPSAEEVLKSLLLLPENSVCADCGAEKPNWAVTNVGAFICLMCAGVHRSLGPHISKVRSVTLDLWTDEMVEKMKEAGGNSKVNANWEAMVEALHAESRRPSHCTSPDVRRRWIEAKYKHREFMRLDFASSLPELAPSASVTSLPASISSSGAAAATSSAAPAPSPSPARSTTATSAPSTGGTGAGVGAGAGAAAGMGMVEFVGVVTVTVGTAQNVVLRDDAAPATATATSNTTIGSTSTTTNAMQNAAHSAAAAIVNSCIQRLLTVRVTAGQQSVQVKPKALPGGAGLGAGAGSGSGASSVAFNEPLTVCVASLSVPLHVELVCQKKTLLSSSSVVLGDARVDLSVHEAVLSAGEAVPVDVAVGSASLSLRLSFLSLK